MEPTDIEYSIPVDLKPLYIPEPTFKNLYLFIYLYMYACIHYVCVSVCERGYVCVSVFERVYVCMHAWKCATQHTYES